MKKRQLRAETLLSHLGRDPGRFDGAVNPPVYHASTIITDCLATYEDPGRRDREGQVFYGRYGTPTTFALEEAIAELEGGEACFVAPSGIAAISTALLAFLEAGDHILVCDSAYRPTRTLCDGLIRRLGIETTYFDPRIGDALAELMRPNTRLVFVESPGSLSFEMMDIPALSSVAHAAGAKVVMDSTWAASLLCRPFELGVDVSVHAGTKYIVGHSDAMMGLITVNRENDKKVRATVRALGQTAGPDDVYLALRGLRTLAVRLARHQETGLRLARWLSERPEVERILHPALPEDPGHEIWRRDFTGACGLFGVVLKEPCPHAGLAAMIDGLELFGIGASWGGYESLMITAYPERFRSVTTWDAPGRTLRIHAGLEHADDLIADLEAGFDRFNQVIRANS